MPTYLERYQAGEHAAVWEELIALGEGVRSEPYITDASAVAAATMRRARHNVETLIRRLDEKGYRFQDSVSTAEDNLSRLDVMSQLAEQFGSRAAASTNVHVASMLERFREIQKKTAPMLEKAAARAAQQATAGRKPPLEDTEVFCPPGKRTQQSIAKLEKGLGGPLPLSLRAWYEQVGGVSLMGSHPVLNAVDFSNRGVLGQFASLSAGRVPVPSAGGEQHAPDPLVVYPIDELLGQFENSGDGSELVIAPDDLHKAHVSGDAYYISLPDARADFPFDDWHKTTFVNYLRITFQWGGFPGWQRSRNPPREIIAELTDGLLPI